MWEYEESTWYIWYDNSTCSLMRNSCVLLAPGPWQIEKEIIVMPAPWPYRSDWNFLMNLYVYVIRENYNIWNYYLANMIISQSCYYNDPNSLSRIIINLEVENAKWKWSFLPAVTRVIMLDPGLRYVRLNLASKLNFHRQILMELAWTLKQRKPLYTLMHQALLGVFPMLTL